jgi:hypothetical protein
MNVFIRCSFIKGRDYKTICNFAGEVERLLREYTQNQEMVRNIGSHYYQIIYPVQLRQHKKMGISTREIGSSKVRKERSTVCHSTSSSHYSPSLPLELGWGRICISLVHRPDCKFT